MHLIFQIFSFASESITNDTVLKLQHIHKAIEQQEKRIHQINTLRKKHNDTGLMRGPTAKSYLNISYNSDETFDEPLKNSLKSSLKKTDRSKKFHADDQFNDDKVFVKPGL